MKTLAAALSLAALPCGAAAQSGDFAGLPVADISGRLTAAGLAVEAPLTQGDRTYLRVTDGPLRFAVTLYNCTPGGCPDLQFTAAFPGPRATETAVNAWNGERRFVKAFYAAAEGDEAASAVAQYDVLLSPGAGPAQLDDHIQVWRALAADLGRTVNAPLP